MLNSDTRSLYTSKDLAVRRMLPFIVVAILPLTSGCLAKAAFDVATAPVRVAGKAVDLATTSQSEADEKRGRRIREREERLGALERRYRRQVERCEQGRRAACEEAEETYAEIDRLLTAVPDED